MFRRSVFLWSKLENVSTPLNLGKLLVACIHKMLLVFIIKGHRMEYYDL